MARTKVKKPSLTVSTPKDVRKVKDAQMMANRLESCELAIETAISSYGQSAWLIGHNLLEIKKDSLWKSTKAKNFTAYLRSKDWAMTPATAYNFIAIAEKLSADEACAYGLRAAYLVARADERDMPVLKKAAEQGGFEAVKEKAAQLRKKRGVTRSPGRKPLKKTLKKSEAAKRVETQPEVGATKLVLDLAPLKTGPRHKAGYTSRATGKLDNGQKILVFFNPRKKVCIVEVK